MGISIHKINFNFALKLPKKLAIHTAIIVTMNKHIDKAITLQTLRAPLKDFNINT